MDNFTFFTLLIAVSILFIFRNKVYTKLIKDNTLIKISVENFNILIILLFLIIILIGSMKSDKKRFASISNNIDNLKTPSEQKRPHPMFDINTYKD